VFKFSSSLKGVPFTMGCTISTGENDSNPRLFNVYNVDDQGQELTPGKIEVGNTELILYQKSKEPIRWPLRCVRRYGFDAELFSFESGRRCPTGPGIYAFKCKKAEALFNLLQECIRQAGQEEQQRYNASSSLPMNAMSVSRNDSLETAQTTNAGNLLNSNMFLSQGDEPASPGHHYVNGDIASKLPPMTSESRVTSDEEGDHEYMNAMLPQPPNEEAELIPMADLNLVRVEVDGGAEPEDNEDPASCVNYAVLDLPQSMESLSHDTNVTNDHDRKASAYSTDSDTPQPVANYMNLDYVPDGPEAAAAASAQQDSTYVNVNSETINQNGGRGRRGSSNNLLKRTLQKQASLEQHNYANLDLMPNGNGTAPPAAPRPPVSVSVPPSAAAAAAAARNNPTRNVNYIQLDLDHNSDVSSVTSTSPASPRSIGSNGPESPVRRPTESYATIDFDKTAALSNSAKASNDEGSRRTRHSSTVSDPAGY
jgi:fibroblast growth factor receptor substrate 2